MNKIILIGRLTNDVELRYSQTNSTVVAKFCVAVNRRYAKPGEERQTDFINVVAWNKLGENANNYLRKGMQVAVSGRLETRSWEDKEGNKKYATEVIADELEFIDPKRREGPDESILYRDDNKKSADSSAILQGTEFDSGDDLPF